MNRIINSKNLAIAISIIILITHYISREYNYNHWTNILAWDVLAYYIYLPFTFIHFDPGITDYHIVEYIFETYHPSTTFYQVFELSNGNSISMYTIGFAILYAPFFFIGHIWALLGNYPADGFSFPYQFSIANGVIFYIILGIFSLRKVLLELFSEKTTMIVLVLLIMGTSYFHETLAEEVMPHAIMFSCFSIILYLNIRWHKNPTKKTSFLLGLITGLSILARGSGIIIGLIILLWNVYDKDSLIKKWKLFISHWEQIAIGIIGLFVFPMIQIIFWKAITGHFIFNNYQVTPGFDWLEPHVIKVLFSYKKGWLLYTPMISFVILGLFFIKKYNRNISWAVISFILLNFYMISSWGTWWQGGSFGSRYFVDSYPILAIPLASFVTWVTQKKFLRPLFLILASFFVFLNLFQTWQFNNWIFDGYTMTKEYYWKVFLKTKVNKEDRKLREIVRSFETTEEFTNPQDYTRHTIGFLDFEKINSIQVDSAYIDTTHFVSPPNSCKITKSQKYGPTFNIPYFILTDREHAWIKVTFDYFVEHDLKESPANLVIEMNHNKGQYIEKYRSWGLENENFKINQWNHFSVDYLTPYPLSTKNDVFNIYVYLRGDKSIYIDNMHIEVFERKW